MKKLKESGVPPTVMGRLGHSSGFDVSMEEYAIQAFTSGTALDQKLSTVKQLADRIENYRIFGSTVLTASRSNLLQKFGCFDRCIMDEAGQISQPAALGGMLLASKFLLVGDDYQLPPLVVSLEAQVEVSCIIALLV